MSISAQWCKVIQGFSLSKRFRDLVCCNVALHACNKAFQWRTALELLRTFPQVFVRPDAVSYNVLTGDRWQHASVFVQEMTAGSIRATMKWYNRAGHVASGGWSQGWSRTVSFFQSAQEAQIPPDAVTLNTLLSARGHRWDWALVSWKMMKMARAARKVTDLSSTDQVTSSTGLTTGLTGDQVTNAILISIKTWMESLAFLQDLRWNRHKPSCMICSAAIKTIERSNCWTAAFDLLQHSNADVTSYSATAACLPEQIWPQALCLMKTVSQEGLQNDVVSLNSVLGVLGQRWNLAAQVFERISTAQLEASQTSHCSVLHLLDQADSMAVQTSAPTWQIWQMALKSLLSFHGTAVEIDTASYNAVLASCEKCGRWRECLRLLEVMDGDQDDLPDELTFNAVICILAETTDQGCALLSKPPLQHCGQSTLRRCAKLTMVSATSGGAAAQALRALRRAAQLHTERRASATKPAKLDAVRTRGRGRAMLGSSQPDPVPCSQPSATQPSSQLPSSQLPSSQMPSSQLPSSQLPSSQLYSSQLPLSQADTLAGDKCGSQRDPRDVLASMSTQTPLSNVPPSSLDTLPSQAAMPEAVPAKQAPLRAAAQAPAAFQAVQAPQSGVAEAAAALAAALATFAGSGASQEVVRRRYRCKAPPPGPSTPPSSIRRRSPSSTQRKRKPVRKVKSRAEVIKEVCSKTIWASVSRLSEEVRKMEKERAAHRTRCQKAVTEALRLLNDHQKACKESSEAFAGTAKAADAALAAVAALERSQGAEHSRLPVPTNSLRASMAGHSVLPPPGQLKKRVRRIDGITASNCI
eukprot:s1398_g9.t1